MSELQSRLDSFRQANGELRRAITEQDWAGAEAAAQSRHEALLALWQTAGQDERMQLAGELELLREQERALVQDVITAREGVLGALQQLRSQHRAANRYSEVGGHVAAR